MATTRHLALDLAVVRDARGRVLTTLAWGDEVRVVDATDAGLVVRVPRLVDAGDGLRFEETEGVIRRPSPRTGLTLDDVLVEGREPARVLRVDFVDVQQGDGAVLETPGGKIVLVDGGDNQLFARYLAARFPGTSDAAPKEIDAIVVTHGDADHFVGLARIRDSETHPEPRKRVFIHPRRVYHNGLVKRPSSRDGRATPDVELLGPTAPGDGRDLLLTGLVDDLRRVPDSEMNEPFLAWKAALRAWTRRGPVTVRRLARGSRRAFDFLEEGDGVSVEVLGPILTTGPDGERGLRFLGSPASKIAGRPGDRPRPRGRSASHTINGHSVILRVTYGNVRLLFAGDLNEESQDALLAAHEAGRGELTAEVLKVPHHGSADFSAPFLRAVSPVVSVVSSGDETARKEYIHPRATLVGALGRYGRPDVAEPLVFVTELAAFFQMEGWITADPATARRAGAAKRRVSFFAFSRRAFGMVKVRTDGERLLVYTYSGKDDMKEAYAFRVDAGGRVTPDVVRSS